MKRGRLIAWVVGPIALFGINFARDIARLQSRYEWEVAAPRTLRIGVPTPGVMEAGRVAEIKSQVEESVFKELVAEGAPVKKGQSILELTRQRTSLEFQQRENAHSGLEAEYKKARRELAIQKKLLRNMAVARQQVDDAAQNVEKYRAAFEVSRQEIALAREKLESTTVRSPMDGVLLKKFTKEGQGLSPGKEIALVGDISKFVVRAKVDELDIARVRVGQPVEIRADAFPNVVMKGVVSSIATQAERDTFAKVEVLIDINDHASATLKHNLSVRVNIITGDVPGALSVPVRSVIKKEGDHGVVVVRNRFHLVERRRVKLGSVGGDRIQILSGLAAGEKVGSEKSPELGL